METAGNLQDAFGCVSFVVGGFPDFFLKIVGVYLIASGVGMLGACSLLSGTIRFQEK